MVIEDNYFHIAGAAILIEGDANYRYEQSGVRDVVIRRNLFENGNYGSPGWGSACIAVGSGIPDRETSRYHRNIRVEVTPSACSRVRELVIVLYVSTYDIIHRLGL